MPSVGYRSLISRPGPASAFICGPQVADNDALLLLLRFSIATIAASAEKRTANGAALTNNVHGQYPDKQRQHPGIPADL